jgi:hypothetical protein
VTLAVLCGSAGNAPGPSGADDLAAAPVAAGATAARMENGAPGTLAAGALLGWDGRVVLPAIAALAGVATAGETVPAVPVGGALALEAGTDWRTRNSR